MFSIKITPSNIAAPTIYCEQSGEEITDATVANVVWVEQHNYGDIPSVIGAPKVVLKRYDTKEATSKLLGVNKGLNQAVKWMQLDLFLLHTNYNLKFDSDRAQSKADILARF